MINPKENLNVVFSLIPGGICVAAPMYIGEIAETSIRGSLGAFFQLFLTVGILFTFVVGAWTHWRVLSIVSAVFPVLLVAVFWWVYDCLGPNYSFQIVLYIYRKGFYDLQTV